MRDLERQRVNSRNHVIGSERCEQKIFPGPSNKLVSNFTYPPKIEKLRSILTRPVLQPYMYDLPCTLTSEIRYENRGITVAPLSPTSDQSDPVGQTHDNRLNDECINWW